jgi:hypothetical protein
LLWKVEGGWRWRRVRSGGVVVDRVVVVHDHDPVQNPILEAVGSREGCVFEMLIRSRSVHFPGP